MDSNNRWGFIRTVEVKSKKKITYPNIVMDIASFETPQGLKTRWHWDTKAEAAVITDTELESSRYFFVGSTKAPDTDGNTRPPKEIRDNIDDDYCMGLVMVFTTLNIEESNFVFVFTEKRFLNLTSADIVFEE